MEHTPVQNTPEPSDDIIGTIESSSGYESRSYVSSSYSETPTTSLSTSRKRKFNQCSLLEKKFKNKTEVQFMSPVEFENQSSNLYFFSSTLNESLTNKLEKCSISNFTPNFYIERSPSEFESDFSSKRQKIVEDAKYQPKARSAPSTPTKQIQCENFDLSKSKSENFEGIYNATPKHMLIKPLGSPESTEILYSNIPEKTPPSKPKSPQQLKESIKKLNSPAKKRLFKNSKRFVFKKVDKDPVSVFRLKNNCPKILSIIFNYLSEKDLFHVSMVSKSWKNALFNDEKAFRRYLEYVDSKKSNKENYLKKSLEDDADISPPCSPERENFRKCTKLASTLESSQSLRMCPRCVKIAVVEKNIGQCQNINCQYIWCLNCSSFSITGPSNFQDKCQQSELVLGGQSRRRQSLRYILNGDDDLPSFLTDSSLNVSHSKYDSSGYLSEMEFSSPAVKRNLNSMFMGKDKSNILKDFNRNESAVQKKSRRSSLVSVVNSSTPKLAEIIEPSSPPKEKKVVCSRQSKKNLKRLKL